MAPSRTRLLLFAAFGGGRGRVVEPWASAGTTAGHLGGALSGGLLRRIRGGLCAGGRVWSGVGVRVGVVAEEGA